MSVFSSSFNPGQVLQTVGQCQEGPVLLAVLQMVGAFHLWGHCIPKPIRLHYYLLEFLLWYIFTYFTSHVSFTIIAFTHSG